MSYEILLLLFFAAILAAFVDAIAGGGGLIAVPALLLAGLPPVEAIATNKMQATIGIGNTTYAFHRKGLIDWKALKIPLIFAFIGACCGAVTLTHIDSSFLKRIMPVILIVVALYFWFAPKPKPMKYQISAFLFGLIFVFPIAFYDGFFGPGAGSFYLLAIVALYGLDLLKANAHNKALNCTSNFASLTVYLLAGKVVWSAASVMIVGQLIGSYLGTKATFHYGASIIRPLVVIMCLALALKMLFF